MERRAGHPRDCTSWTRRAASASASADGEKMEIERAGPVAACVRFEGFYTTADGANLARHITRVEAFAGQPFARVTHTLVLTNDTNEVWFKEIGWELAASAGERPQAVFGTSRDDFHKTQTLPVPAGATVSHAAGPALSFRRGKEPLRRVAGGGRPADEPGGRRGVRRLRGAGRRGGRIDDGLQGSRSPASQGVRASPPARSTCACSAAGAARNSTSACRRW